MYNFTNNSYESLKGFNLKNKYFEIHSIRRQDIEEIRKWRNSQIDILRQEKKLTKNEQIKYFENEVFPEFKKKFPKQILFSLLINDRLLAYGGLVHINWKDRRAEISFLVESSLSGKKEDTKYLLPNFIDFLKKLAFNHFRLNKLCAELYDIRPEYKKLLLNKNFLIEGVLKKHVKIKNNYKNSFIFGCLRN